MQLCGRYLREDSRFMQLNERYFEEYSRAMQLYGRYIREDSRFIQLNERYFKEYSRNILRSILELCNYMKNT